MANIVGDWSITTDWGCDGSITGTFTQTFKADGTWSTTPFVHHGRWFQVDDMAAWTFDDTPHLVYAAHLIGSWIEGAMGYEDPNGIKGCFGGQKTGVSKALAAYKNQVKAGVKDPMLGK